MVVARPYGTMDWSSRLNWIGNERREIIIIYEHVVRIYLILLREKFCIVFNIYLLIHFKLQMKKTMQHNLLIVYEYSKELYLIINSTQFLLILDPNHSPTFTKCSPEQTVFYTAKKKSSMQVFWEEPTATDLEDGNRRLVNYKHHCLEATAHKLVLTLNVPNFVNGDICLMFWYK